MHEESAFLRKLLDNPADDTTRLVYADWLDEQDDPATVTKSRFLRLTVRVLDPERQPGEDDQLQMLATELDPEWLSIVSSAKIENCELARTKQDANVLWEKYGIRFNVVCDRRWDELTPTAQTSVRHCGDCQRDVYWFDSIDAAREHAWDGNCVAVNLGVVRKEYDLEQPLVTLGMIYPSDDV